MVGLIIALIGLLAFGGITWWLVNLWFAGNKVVLTIWALIMLLCVMWIFWGGGPGEFIWHR